MRKTIAVISTLLLISLCLFSVTFVSADVPSMISITTSQEGENTIVGIEIRHSSPSPTHYVDIIEVEVNERLDRINDLDPQTSTTFTHQHNIGTLQYGSVRVRAHCTDHGWSSRVALENGEPETPFFETTLGTITISGIIIIIIIAVLLVIMKRR